MWICEVHRIGGRHEWQVVVICSCCSCSSSRSAFSLRMACAPAGNPQSFHTFLISQHSDFLLLYATNMLVQSVPKWKASIFVRITSVRVVTACHEDISLPIISRATDSSSSRFYSDVVEVLILGVPM